MSRSDSTSENTLAMTTHEFFAPTAVKPLFWRPRFRANSPVQSHAPFLFWLAADARVRHVGVLGADDGFAHFLFCQVIDKLNTPGRCSGIGFWRDQKSGEPRAQPPYLLSDHAEQFYESTSILRSCPRLADALEYINEQRFDILFVDILSLPNKELPRIESIVRLLNDSAVLVIHGTNELRKRDDGTALLKQIQQLDGFDLQDGAGLSVSPVGEEQSIRLRKLMASRENNGIPTDVELVFRRLGQSLVALEEARSLKKKAISTEKELAKAQDDTRRVYQELADLREAYDQRNRKMSQTQTLVFDLQNDLSSAERALDGARSELAIASESRTADLERIAQLELELEEAQRALISEAAMRSEKIKALTDLLEAARIENAAVRSELDVGASELTAARSELAKIRDERGTDLQRIRNLELKVKEGKHALTAETATRFEETAALTQLLESIRIEKEAVQSELEVQVGALTEARAHLAKIHDEREADLERIAQFEMKLKESQRALAAETKIRFDETAALTRLLESMRIEKEASQSDLVQVHERSKAQLDRIVQIERQLKEAHLKLATLEKENSALLNSTSWKVTAPIRRAKLALREQK